MDYFAGEACKKKSGTGWIDIDCDGILITITRWLKTGGTFFKSILKESVEMNNLIKVFVLMVIVCVLMVGCGSGSQDTKPVVKEPAAQSEAAAEKVAETRRQAASEDNVAASAGQSELTASSAQRVEVPAKVNVYEKTREMDWSLTPERRSAIEQGIPETIGFVDGMSLIKKIIDEDIRGKENRVAVFMEAAKDRYIYLADQTNPNPFNNNASLNLIFGKGAFGPDFMMVQLQAPQNYDHKKYMEIFGGTGYVTAFIGKLSEKEGNLVLDPVYDVYLPGYLD